jgi:hypothetical protein
MADAIHGILTYSSLATHFKEQGKNEVDDLIWLNSAKNVKMIYDQVLAKH